MKLHSKFYLDENINIILAKILIAHGFDVETTNDANNLGKSDEEQFEYAIKQKKTILTHNIYDFEKLVKKYYNENETHHGVIFVFRDNPQVIFKKLLQILDDDHEGDLINQIRYI